MAGRVTTVGVEVFVTGGVPGARVTTVGVEAFVPGGTPGARVTAVGVEVFQPLTPSTPPEQDIDASARMVLPPVKPWGPLVMSMSTSLKV